MAEMSCMKAVEEKIKDINDNELATNYVYTRTNVDFTIGAYRETLKLLENYHRLSGLISLMGCFERYVASIVSLAFSSNGDVRNTAGSTTHNIDGIRLMKLGQFQDITK